VIQQLRSRLGLKSENSFDVTADGHGSEDLEAWPVASVGRISMIRISVASYRRFMLALPLWVVCPFGAEACREQQLLGTCQVASVNQAGYA